MEAMTAAEHARMTARSPWISRLELAALGIGGAIILAPYLLPALGIGNLELAEETMTALHSTSVGTGLAGLLNQGLAAIPLIGPTLAEGGWHTTLASGAIGIGGTLLGNLFAQQVQTPKGLAWCSLITKTALATSMLISLPTVLTGLTAGVVFLSAALGSVAMANSVLTGMAGSVGSVGTVGAGIAGINGLIGAAARLLTCCLPVLPAGMAALMQRQPKGPTFSDAMQLDVDLDPPAANGRVSGRLLLTDRLSGRGIGDPALATVHEHKLHLMAVDGSLQDYQHLHPEPTDEPGIYRFSFQPTRPGPYHFWSDAARASDQHQVSAHAIVGEGDRTVRADVRPQRTADSGGLHFSWSAHPPLRRGQDSEVEIRVSDASGKAVTDLQPIMGAPAHLVGFSADHDSMLHLHPIGAEAGNLKFHIRPESDAPARFFLQVQRGGEIITAPFGQTIYPEKRSPLKQASRPVQAHLAHAR